MFESNKYESRTMQADTSQACHEARACFTIVI